MKYIFDMETQDPDDFLTLLLMLGHPEVDLVAVTVTPGTPEQVGLVREALSWFGVDIPVGAYDIDHPKQCVSLWHERAYGAFGSSRDAEPGGELLCRLCDADTTLVTGGPLKNLGAAIDLGGLTLGRWVAQGGFAGEGVVPAHAQLPKFAGRRTCPTFNFNGASRAALDALAYDGIAARRFVSKNVCHGVVYDSAMHEQIRPVKSQAFYLERIWHGMDRYLSRKRAGKKMHDPLAACCAIDEGVGEWAEVELYRERGEWGARLAPGSGDFIIIGYDHARFVSTLTAGLA